MMINEVFTVMLDHIEEHNYEVDVKITWFEDIEGDFSSWDSAQDYYGYTELEYDILDCRLYDDGEFVGKRELPAELDQKLYDEVMEEALSLEEMY